MRVKENRGELTESKESKMKLERATEVKDSKRTNERNEKKRTNERTIECREGVGKEAVETNGLKSDQQIKNKCHIKQDRILKI